MLDSVFGGGFDLEQELSLQRMGDSAATGQSIRYLNQRIDAMADRIAALELRLSQQETNVKP